VSLGASGLRLENTAWVVPPLSDTSTLSNARAAGIVLLIAGGVLFLSALALLDYLEPSTRTLWELTTLKPLIWTVIAAVVILSAAASPFIDSVIPRLLAMCGSFFLLGQVFPIVNHYSVEGAGLWVAVGATVAMSIGGVLVVARSFARPSSVASGHDREAA
jgi:hypothetical protein